MSSGFQRLAKPAGRKRMRAQVASQFWESLKQSKLLQCTALFVIAALCYHRAGRKLFTLPFVVVFAVFRADILLEIKLCMWYCKVALSFGKIRPVTVVSPNLVLGDVLLSHEQVYEIRKKHHLSAVVSLATSSLRITNTMFGKFIDLQATKFNSEDSNNYDDPIPHNILDVRNLDSISESELKHALQTINRYTTEGKNIYLTCLTGNGIEAAVVLAYMMKYERLSLDAAYEKLRSIRPAIFNKDSKYYKIIESFKKSSD